MKVGDKVYCKNNLIVPSGDVYFSVGYYYEIIEFGSDLVINNNEDCGCIFAFAKINIHNHWTFNNYFNTPKELRKIKLEEINEKM